MKKICFALLLVLVFVRTSFTADITLSWDANLEPDLAGYKVFQAQKQGNKSTVWVEVGETTSLVTTLIVTIPDAGGYVWYVAAFDTEGLVSYKPSNLVFHQWGPPGRVQNLVK